MEGALIGNFHSSPLMNTQQDMHIMELEALQQPLRKPLAPASVRYALLNATWEASDNNDDFDLSTYFEYYSKRIQRLLLDGDCQSVIEYHSDLPPIAKKILLSKTIRGELRQELTDQHDIAAGTNDVDRTIDLCASLITMAEIEVREYSTGLSGCTPIRWKEDSLQVTLAEYFTSQRALQADNSKLGKLFTARNLSRIGGIEIKWTTNLADHLRLINDDQAVFVFHCVGFLRLQDRYGWFLNSEYQTDVHQGQEHALPHVICQRNPKHLGFIIPFLR